jgi:hypothetical protein
MTLHLLPISPPERQWETVELDLWKPKPKRPVRRVHLHRVHRHRGRHYGWQGLLLMLLYAVWRHDRTYGP